MPLLPRQTSISDPSPYRFAKSIPNFLPYRNSLSVVYLVREGPLGWGDTRKCGAESAAFARLQKYALKVPTLSLNFQ